MNPSPIKQQVASPMSQRAEQWLEQLLSALPASMAVMHDDLRTYFRPILMRMAEEANLVTREAFDAQTRVLAETRARLDRVIAELEALEQEDV